MILMNERNKDLGQYVPCQDDQEIICLCEGVTKGEIREKVHQGLMTMKEVRKFLRTGMGPCQGRRCRPKVKAVIEEILGKPAADVEDELIRPSIKAEKMSNIIQSKVVGNHDH